MLPAIIGGIVAIGSAIIGAVGTNKATDTAAQAAAYQADAEVQKTKISADVNKQISDNTSVSNALSGILGYEKQKYAAGALQTGVLIIGIVLVGILFLVKKK